MTGDDFCNRKRELFDISKAISNCEKLFIYSERRLGKTSLAKHALNKLSKKEYRAIYIDLWPTDDEASFAKIIAKAVTESLGGRTSKMLETAKSLFGRLSASITTNDEGKPEITFGITKTEMLGPEIEEVLNAPAKISRQGRYRVVVVFDEIQQILEYGNDKVERLMRSAIQNHKDVSYLFLGSRKHIVQKMFLDKSRPLYRSAGHYPLKPIDEQDWVSFIKKKFFSTGKHISGDHIKKICDLTEGHPFYTQHLCHALWEICEEDDGVTDEMLGQALDILLRREEYAYITLWESLSTNQKRFLRGLSLESEIKPFGSDFVRRYGLGSPSNVQRAVEALFDRDIIDRENGLFTITDRFFKIWVGFGGRGF